MLLKKRASPSTVHQIKVTLKGIRPPIWRRIQVPSDLRLDGLHRILQEVMGWEECHLHVFNVGAVHYGVPDGETDWMEMRDERKARLNAVAPAEGIRFTYEYDFGDSWEHDLLVEKILPAAEGVDYPICIKGKRCGPPEDVGGVYGYQEFLEAILNPDHPEHESMTEWIGGDYDPEEFDLAEINRALKGPDEGPRRWVVEFL